MDADKRHQLKQNELAEMLAKLRDWDSPVTRYALLGLVLLLVLVVGWKTWRYTQQHASEQAWQRLDLIKLGMLDSDPDRVASAVNDLRELIRETSDPAIAGNARLHLARFRYDEGFARPEQRQAAFEEAADLLQQVTGNPETPPMIAAAASFALASTYESLRELDKAETLYETLKSEPRFQGSPFVAVAGVRLDTMDDLAKPVAFTSGDPPVPESALEIPEFEPTTTSAPAEPTTTAPTPGTAPPQTAPTSQPAEPPPDESKPTAPGEGAGQAP